MSRCRFKSSRFSPARMSAADPKFVEEIIAWNEVEELFRKYDKDRTGTLSCDEVAGVNYILPKRALRHVLY